MTTLNEITYVDWQYKLNKIGSVAEGVEAPETQNFKQVFSGVVEDLNTEMNAPDNLMKDVMSGNKNVDIHDVMTAMSKSEIAVNVATQMVGKVINAYDRISQISV